MTQPTIHPSAQIATGADIGEGVNVGPFCVVGEHVRVGAGSVLKSHVVLDGHLTLGSECIVYPFACLGSKTQDLKFKDGDVTYVDIGDHTVIREYVTVNSATPAGTRTVVGNDCLIQAYCHIAHECILGDGIIMSSGAMLSGHVTVGDHAVIGGMAGVVQFVRIGTMAMCGGYTKLTKDIPPFCIADGIPAVVRSVNKIGMERHGESPEAVREVIEAFKLLRANTGPINELADTLQSHFPESTNVIGIANFIRDSTLGLAR